MPIWPQLTVMFFFSLQSDFPYAPSPAYPTFLEDLEAFNLTPAMRNKLNFENAQVLISRLGKHMDELK